MGNGYKRTFNIGDLVTIAPDFRNSVLDFDFERYIGIITSVPEENEYVVYWTKSPQNNYYRGMWNGDHLVKVEDYSYEKSKLRKDLHCIEL